jgi:hypothetical protein
MSGSHQSFHPSGDTAAVGPSPPRDQGRLPPDATDGRLDLIACDRCGRSFATEDGPGMLAAIKGPCPECGGTFQMRPVPGEADDSPVS